MRLAHLSDLHFGHHDEAIAQSLAEDIDRQNVDLVVISGDFTQRGIESEFKAAREFIARLKAPVFSVPGNHDVPQLNLWRRLLDPYDHYREYISPELEPFTVVDGVALAGLKTAHRFMPGFNWSHGSFSRSQLGKLEARFDAAPPDAIRVVVAHHPLLYPEEAGKMQQQTVWRADLALEIFSRLGVRLVLSGHFHLSYVRVHGAEGEVAQGAPTGLREAAKSPILVAQTSSTLSTRLRGHLNAYNLVEFTDVIEIDVREWHQSEWRTRERQVKPAAN
jgi:3',5'-cyclic AMP phosphodiesterase CpdA